jgi:hypothetical protein
MERRPFMEYVPIGEKAVLRGKGKKLKAPLHYYGGDLGGA